MSGQLKEVRDRIGSIKSTQQITKAMKLVAASKLRRAQDNIVRMRPYATKLYEILGNIVAGTEGDVNIAYANERKPEKVLLVVITSNRGLCGAFNSGIAKMAKKCVKEKYSEQQAASKIDVLCIGKKGYDALKKEKGLNFNTEHLDLLTKLAFDETAKVAEVIMQEFISKKYDAVEVAYSQFKNQVVQIPTVEQFLPIQKIEGQKGKETETSSKLKADFIYEPDKLAIIEELVPKILKTQFYRYLLDNNASEHGARMTAMANATENAEDLIRELKIKYNRARQAAITTELTEIIAGAAALQG